VKTRTARPHHPGCYLRTVRLGAHRRRRHPR
jgi:hypothetical protein